MSTIDEVPEVMDGPASVPRELAPLQVSSASQVATLRETDSKPRDLSLSSKSPVANPQPQSRSVAKVADQLGLHLRFSTDSLAGSTRTLQLDSTTVSHPVHQPSAGTAPIPGPELVIKRLPSTLRRLHPAFVPGVRAPTSSAATSATHQLPGSARSASSAGSSTSRHAAPASWRPERLDSLAYARSGAEAKAMFEDSTRRLQRVRERRGRSHSSGSSSSGGSSDEEAAALASLLLSRAGRSGTGSSGGAGSSSSSSGGSKRRPATAGSSSSSGRSSGGGAFLDRMEAVTRSLADRRRLAAEQQAFETARARAPWVCGVCGREQSFEEHRKRIVRCQREACASAAADSARAAAIATGLVPGSGSSAAAARSGAGSGPAVPSFGSTGSTISRHKIVTNTFRPRLQWDDVADGFLSRLQAAMADAEARRKEAAKKLRRSASRSGSKGRRAGSKGSARSGRSARRGHGSRSRSRSASRSRHGRSGSLSRSGGLDRSGGSRGRGRLDSEDAGSARHHDDGHDGDDDDEGALAPSLRWADVAEAFLARQGEFELRREETRARLEAERKRRIEAEAAALGIGRRKPSSSFVPSGQMPPFAERQAAAASRKTLTFEERVAEYEAKYGPLVPRPPPPGGAGGAGGAAGGSARRGSVASAAADA